MLGELDDVAIADGETPDNPANPDSLKYVLAHRTGKNLSSMFTSVIEPYEGESYIKSVSEVKLTANKKKVTGDDARAVKIELKDGKIYYVVISLDSDITYTVDSKFQFKGFFGVYTEKDGLQTYGYVNDGTMIGGLVNCVDKVSGTVDDFTKDLSLSNEITIKADNSISDVSSLAGRYIYVENDGERNACYLIKNAEKLENGNIRLDIGDSTLIRGYADSYDFSKGYIYDIAPGQKISIPLSENANLKAVTPTLTEK
jgi:hypothetical protein